MVERNKPTLIDLTENEGNFLLSILGFKGNEDDNILDFYALPIQVKLPSMAKKIRDIQKQMLKTKAIPEELSNVVDFFDGTPLEKITLEELAILVEKEDKKTGYKKFWAVCEEHKIPILEFPPNPKHDEVKPDETNQVIIPLDPPDNSLSSEPTLNNSVLQSPDPEPEGKNNRSSEPNSERKVAELAVLAPIYKTRKERGVPLEKGPEHVIGLTTNAKQERLKKIAFCFFETTGGDYKYKTMEDVACEIYQKEIRRNPSDDYLRDCVVKITQSCTSLSSQIEKIFSMPSWLNPELNDDFMQGFYKSLRDHPLYMDLNAEILIKIMKREISFQEVCVMQNIVDVSTLADFTLN